MCTSGIKRKYCRYLTALLLSSWGCQLTPPPQYMYYLHCEPVLAADDRYYVDPTDSSVVWSQEGLQVKVRPVNDSVLNAEFGVDATNPYTLGQWQNEAGFTPPLHTVFHVTIINRTRERVEMDLTRVVLRLDNGYRSYAADGPWDGPRGRTDYERKRYRTKETGAADGPWDHGYPFSYKYVYPYRGDDDGKSRLRTQDRTRVFTRSALLREKPVRKGQKHDGMVAFPPLPADVRSFALEVNDFILAFDSNEVGYGNPVETTDMVFHFEVDHGVMLVDRSRSSAQRALEKGIGQ